MPLPQEAPTKIWNKNFICVCLGNLGLGFANFSINPLVASYTTFLGAGAELMGLLTGMYFGISLLMKPVSGPAMTKIDKRHLMIFTFAIGGVANLGYAAFHTLLMFAVFRLLSGIEYSLVGGLLLVLAGDCLPADRMTAGIGFYGVGQAVGMALAPSIGIWLVDLGTGLRDEAFGYTILFLFAAAVLFLSVIPALILRPVRRSREEIASTGAWYKNILTPHALPTALVLMLVFLSYALLNAYVVNLAEEQHIGDVNAFFLVLAAVIALSRPICGHLTDKYGVGKTALPSIIIYAAAFLIIGFSKSLVMILIGAAAAAIGSGGSQPTIQAMGMQTEAPVKRSVASNTMYIGMDLGFFLGPILGGFVEGRSNFAAVFKVGAIPLALAAVCFVIILPMFKRRVAQLRDAGQ